MPLRRQLLRDTSGPWVLAWCRRLHHVADSGRQSELEAPGSDYNRRTLSGSVGIRVLTEPDRFSVIYPGPSIKVCLLERVLRDRRNDRVGNVSIL
jgi:hypothetical protein